MRFIDRLQWAAENLRPINPRYRIIWEDPDEPDEPCKITAPAPEWLAAAMFGNIVPPVEAYHRLIIVGEGKEKRLFNGHILDEETIPAMTEEQAMEYLVKKDLPRRVWDDPAANRPHFKIIPHCMVPADRSLRNSWRLHADA